LGLVEHKGVELLHLRNPWGSDEWKGAWATGSKEWTDEMKEACKEEKEHDQGSFWISRKDFFENFGSVQGVRNFDHNYKCTATYSSIAQDNKVEQEVTFAVAPTAQVPEIIIVLAQRDARLRSEGKHDDYPIQIGFDIYKCDKPEDVYEDEPKTELFYSSPLQSARSISASLKLSPDDGYYLVPHVVVPEELKAKKKNVAIFLRCYATCDVKLDEMYYDEEYEDEEDDEDEDEDDDEEEDECTKCKKKDATIKELRKLVKTQEKKIAALEAEAEDEEEQ